MEMHFQGIIIAVLAFLTIGVFHPIVIKTEYYSGTRYWWLFLVAGIVSLAAALFVAQPLPSSLFGIVGASCLWSIKELFEQKERVTKGWFPMNPSRRDDYHKTTIKVEDGAGNNRKSGKGMNLSTTPNNKEDRS